MHRNSVRVYILHENSLFRKIRKKGIQNVFSTLTGKKIVNVIPGSHEAKIFTKIKLFISYSSLA